MCFDVLKEMVGKKSKGLFLWVFALMDPKVGPMDLGTCAGLGAIWDQPWNQILIPPSGPSRPI